MSTNTQNELESMCKGIRDDLEEIYNGDKAQELEDKIDELEERLENTDDENEQDEIQAEIDELTEEKDKLTFWDYFNDALDIAYTISANGEYRGVRIMVACGGPNIYVDTTRGEVWGAWWGDKAAVWLPSEICNEIDAVFEEYYQCTR